MKTLFLLVLVGIHGATAVTHSLKYFFTSSSQVPNFPEFVVVGLVDDVEMIHYDSNTQKAEPKQDWMKEAADPQYWERETGNLQGSQQWFKGNIVTAKQRFNQTGGVHVFQEMYGCEWDDETQEVTGFWQYGYDGEDFIAFNLKTKTWIAPSPQAVITRHKWDNDKADAAQRENYLTQICPEWGKKYVNYGRSSLMRTVPPSVSLLQKTPSSPVSCHATGFYPNKAVMFWRKNGEELHEDVDQGEILPNHDGSFQMTVDLDVSSVKHEDWENYDCVFQLSGLEDDILTKLKKNGGGVPVAAVIGGVVGLLVLVAGVVGVIVWWKKKEEQNGFKPANTSDTSSSSSSQAEAAEVGEDQNMVKA